MNFSVDKQIDSLNNPEYKFLVSLKKNRNRKSNNKSLAEGFRECCRGFEPAPDFLDRNQNYALWPLRHPPSFKLTDDFNHCF